MEIAAHGFPSNTRVALRGECPHCNYKVSFEQKTDTWQERSSSASGDRWISALRCAGCHQFILGIVGFSKTGALSLLEYYPLGEARQVESDDIPANILADFNEALRCRSVDAYNATAEMCRRALQSSCLSLGANPSLNLRSQIDWLFAQGCIIEPLKDMAHKVRLGGNRGAHPADDPLTELPLGEPEADALLSFTWKYLESIYVSPAEMKRFDFSRNVPKKLKP